MIRILAFLAALVALAPTQAHAQASVVIYCYNGATPNVTVPCSAATPLQVSSSGGGGGGLSVLDGASWTAGVSNFTPSGGEYNPSATPLSSGQQGTLALDANRAAMVDTPTTNNNLYAALTAAIPSLAATAFNTCSYTTGQTMPLCMDLNGNLYAHVSNTVTTTTAAADPCQTQTHTYTPINYSASGLNSTPLIAGTSAKKTYICHVTVQNNALDAIGIIETTTGTSCATDVRALWGGATHTSAAAGWNFSANGGIALGNGSATIAQTSTNNDDVCFIQSAATQATGGVEWVQQ